MFTQQQPLPIDQITDSQGEQCLAIDTVDAADAVDIKTFAQLRSIWVSVGSDEQLHLKQFIPSGNVYGDASNNIMHGRGKSVFLLHGEAESGSVYYGANGRGLAWEMAAQGYEVFVADLGGRGRSITALGQSHLTVNQLICEAIPALLKAAAQHSVIGRQNGATHDEGGSKLEAYSQHNVGHQPDIWVGHGFGAVLLSAAWARIDESLRGARRMVFINGRRRLHGVSWQARAFGKLLSSTWLSRVAGQMGRLPFRSLNLGTADENPAWLSTYANWLGSSKWCDTTDGFNYGDALKGAGLPPVLHIAAKRNSYFSSPSDVRSFVDELGPHDARIIFVDKDERQKQHNHLSLLLDIEGSREVFGDILSWLQGTETFDQHICEPLIDLTSDQLADRGENLVGELAERELELPVEPADNAFYEDETEQGLLYSRDDARAACVGA